MFQKLVAIEPVSLIPSAEQELSRYAKEVRLFGDIPADNDEIVRRIGDADAALLSYTSRIDRDVIERCPNLRYIGMCCSLYSEASANVDIAFARSRGIRVLGIRDYGDRGVVEYVLHELTGILHGFGMPMLHDEPVEIYGLKVGIVGDIGHSRVCGSLIPALKIMGAEVTVVGPATLMPACPEVLGADHVTPYLDDVLPELDVVYMLRIQRERLEGAPFPSLREYHELFGLTKKREHLMRPDAIVCHPGPINRGVEFDSYMADHPERSVILEQVYAGICVRMAVLYLLLGGAE